LEILRNRQKYLVAGGGEYGSAVTMPAGPSADVRVCPAAGCCPSAARGDAARAPRVSVTVVVRSVPGLARSIWHASGTAGEFNVGSSQTVGFQLMR